MFKPIDEIRTGDYRSLFHPEMLISGKEDAANNCTSKSINRVDNVINREQTLVVTTPLERNWSTMSLTAFVALQVRTPPNQLEDSYSFS